MYFSAPFYASAENFSPQSLMDWKLISVAQIGFLNRRIHYAQNKTLFDSSALNAMIYQRGTFDIYQKWANFVENNFYTLSNLMPFFKKSCKFNRPNDRKRKILNATVKFDAQAFSSNDGFFQILYSNWVNVALTWFQRAFAAINLPISEERFNSESLNNRSSWISFTIDPVIGKRFSFELSFLKQSFDKNNLFVYTQTQTAKILFNSTTAHQVDVQTQNVKYVISARKEKILSVEIFYSPQLLMLSDLCCWRTALNSFSLIIS